MNILSIHSLHIWTISTGKNSISLHAIVTEKIGLVDMNNLLMQKYKFKYSSIQLETVDEGLTIGCIENVNEI